jgi:uncharacterized membrane protein
MTFADGFNLGFWGLIGYVTAYLTLIVAVIVTVVVVLFVLVAHDTWKARKSKAIEKSNEVPF